MLYKAQIQKKIKEILSPKHINNVEKQTQSFNMFMVINL